MPVTVQNSPDTLCGEILAAARRESEEIIARSRKEAAALVAAAEAQVEKIRAEAAAQAQVEAARRQELVLATLAVETERLHSSRVEALLESVRAAIRGRLLAGAIDGRQNLAVLAGSAIRQMPATSFVVNVSANDLAAYGGSLAEDINRWVSRPMLKLAVSADKEMTCGIKVRDAEGCQYWDNQPLARLERLWPELRRQIGLQILSSQQPPTGDHP